MRSAFAVEAPRVTALRALNYTPEVEAFRARAKRKSCPRFRDLVETLGPAYGSVFTRIDCHPSHGVEFLPLNLRGVSFAGIRCLIQRTTRLSVGRFS
jgi:hypothetical protein